MKRRPTTTKPTLPPCEEPPQRQVAPAPSAGVPVIGEANFAHAPAALPIGQAVVKLTDYQMRAITDTSRIVVLCWCRQAGKDFTTSLKAVLDAIESGQNWYIISLTQRQALATAKKAQQHIRAITGALPDLGVSEETINGIKITSYGVKLPNGAEIVALPGKDPDALAGLSGNVILTEMALFPRGGVDHWRVVFPLATRGFRIWAISTPRGPNTKFAELRRNPKGKYSVHNVDIDRAVAEGLELKDESGKPITTAELEAIYADSAGWKREYKCEEGEDHEPLIGWEHITRCLTTAAPDLPWLHLDGTRPLRNQFDPQLDTVFAPARATMTGRPVLGWDIAVTGDLTAIPFGELLGDVVHLRSLVTMRKVDDFDYQKDVVRCALKLGATGVGDASGLGRESCAKLEKEYPAHFKGLVFTGESKSALCVQLMERLQGGRFRLPAGASTTEIQYDLAALSRESIGVARRLRVVANRNPLLPASHCDIAMGIAMMLDAAQNGSSAYFAPESYQPTGTGEEY